VLPVLGSDRSPHVRVFLHAVKRLAGRRRIRMIERSRTQVAQSLGTANGVNRYRLAARVADQFPILQAKLPPPRKPWQPQDLRLSAFYAVALALTAKGAKPMANWTHAADRQVGRESTITSK